MVRTPPPGCASRVRDDRCCSHGSSLWSVSCCRWPAKWRCGSRGSATPPGGPCPGCCPRGRTPAAAPRSERQILEAIVHIACTRQAWPRLPPALGPFLACRRRFLHWHDDGTLQRICRAALPEQDAIWQQQLAAYIDLSA
ncbi:transposase [Streptomyces sp. NPDC088337]|uniref:transposase n=1 Tax=unclassified Streptomyces TaxID=2593676 RepID=UPI00382810C9